ncbi:MAG: immunoglobulin domain-containing protein [Opitutae bacterium]|nr:immunoglobulin domain-containing protein [Opitutae bacterium]
MFLALVRPVRRALARGGAVIAALLALAAPLARGQLKWSAYDPATGALLGGTTFEQAATFDPATNSYALTIPANSAVTFVATNFIPIDMAKPASSSTTSTITFQVQTSAGGFSSINKYTNFGLFHYPAGGAPSETSNNATTHSGLWVSAYNNGTTVYQTKPCGSPNSAAYSFASGPDYKLASSNISQGATGFGLGTSRLTGVGTIADSTTYNVTFRVRANSAGTTQLGSSATEAAGGAVWVDAATGGTNFKQAVYSSTTNNGFTCPAAMNEFAFYFENGSANAVTLTLANLQAYTSGGTTFVMGPAYFTTQPPANITATVGGVLTIAATPVAASVSGGPATTYQWQFSSDDGANYSDLDAGANASAATTSLSISNTQSSHAGKYRLKATTTYTGAVSGATTLTSYSNTSTVAVTTDALPPSIVTPPAAASILVGGANTFTVVAGGSTPFTYQWSRSTDGGANYSDISDATSSSYTLSNAALADTGLYRVTVTNSEGSATSSAATLTVQQAPVISAQPVGGTLAPGGSITLAVTATGTPAPTYQWKKNGATISGATSSSYTISSATGADTANYTVTIANSVGSVTSATASVVVASSTMAATALAPAASGTCNPDARLAITFNETPTIGVSGYLRIYDAANDSVVDTIDLVAATAARDTLRAASTLSTQLLPVQAKAIGGITTNFNYYPITVSGNTATIYPRNGVLAYGKTYYVKVDAGVFVNAAGEAFAGIADTTSWRFTTKSAGPASGATSLTVAADGSGDFDTVQAALDSIPANNTTPTVIRVKSGTYFEEVGFQSKHYVTILGEDADQTIIAYPNNNTFNNVSGVYHRATLVAQSVHDFTLANLTVSNTTPQNGSQAEAIVLNGTSATSGRNVVTRCKFFSYQDTVQFNKQTYVSDCTIWGDVDFMWGDGPAFLENCDIRMFRSGGYFTQIRNGSSTHGYVFVNCRFTAPAGVTGTYFGRIDPTAYPYSEVVVLDSTIGDATNNAFLATATGANGSNYTAGWWLLNGVTTAANASNVRYWDGNNVDGAAAATSNPDSNAFTTMPADATTLANYRSAAWVLNTSMAGAVNGSWTPALAPLIAQQPAAQTVALGDPATFSVTALGVPAATYQWYKDGNVISGATAATYTIAAAGASDPAAYSVVVTNSAGSATSDLAPLTVTGIVVAPTILTHPASVTVAETGSATLSVAATGTDPLSYQWKKGADDLPGATASSYTISNATSADAGSYTVVVSNSAGSATSNAAVVSVKASAAVVLDGYAASVTGGAAGPTVTVSTVNDLKNYAKAATPYTIVVSGTIDLGEAGRVNVTSNKTIRGANVSSTILGTVNISNCDNVIVSNLNISANTGLPSENDGVTIASSTRVLVTKCTIYNATDGNLDVINGSDLVTVSWCKFYYTRDNGHNFSNLVGSSDTDTGTGDGLTNYRISWHHNWWAAGAKQRMIACRFGSSHMFNNLWDCAGDDYCTESRNIASILSEHNYYDGVDDPLAKRTALVTDVGLLMTIGNVFNACTGTQLVSSDAVFSAPYAYRVFPAAAVPALVRAGAGNTIEDAPAAYAAAALGPAGAVYAGDTVTLTASPSGFTPTSYQWRYKNAALAGATAATLTLADAQDANEGAYTVVLGLDDGSFVVSSPYTLTVDLSPRQTWRQQNFGTIANTGNAADSADPDSDGLSNLVEYALGLDPNVASATGAPAMSTDDTNWVYTYTRPASRADLAYDVEASTDLATWSANGVTHTLVSTTGGVSTYTATYPRASADKLFFRLKITSP